MSRLPVNKGSFFVDPGRKDGLRLTLAYEDDMVACDLKVDTRFQGYEDVVHGGMIFGILEVMMWHAVRVATGKVCMTRKMDMDFLKPVFCNIVYKARARFLKIDDKDVYASAWIENENHEICAEGTALFREKLTG